MQNRLSKLIWFKVDRLSRFRTGARQVFTTEKPFSSEIPLTIKTATSNTV